MRKLVLGLFGLVLMVSASAPAEDEVPSKVPEIAGVVVSDVKASSAQVKVYVDTKGVPSTVVLEYGTTSKYGKSVEMRRATDKSPHQRFILTTQLQGLMANTAYHYRVVIRYVDARVLTEDDYFVTEEATGL